MNHSSLINSHYYDIYDNIMITTITSNYQMNIPLKIRKKMKHIKPGKATIVMKGKSLIITPLDSPVLKLAGSFRVKNPIPAEHIREFITYEP